MKKYLIIGIASLSILFTSCLKDKKVEDRKYGMNGVEEGKIIELAVDGHFVSYGLDFKNLDTVFGILEVRLAADLPAPEDLTVVLSLDNSLALLTAYNTANGTSLVQFPLNLYTLPNGLTVTIPAGKRSAFIKLGTNTSNFNPSLAYALGFRIASVSKPGYTISGNFGNAIAAFAAKNQFDGEYEITGTYSDAAPAGAAFTSVYPLLWQLVTTGPTRNTVYDADNFATPTPAYIFYTGTGYSYYGSFGLIINFDAANNVTSVTNFYGQPSANGRSANLDPSGINKYDPATKTIKIKYWMDQPSVVTPHRAYFNETWKYLGPRP
jgi:Domain of unknown function (DUF1735)